MRSLLPLFFCPLLMISCDSEVELNEIKPINRIDKNEPEIFQKNGGVNDLGDTSSFRIVELESVNTHRFSKERLKEEKRKINKILLSYRYFDWKNPTSGGAVHISREDKIEVYNLLFWPADSMKMVSKEVELEDVWSYVQGYTWGNSPSVLVTSELNPKQSTSLLLVIDELFEHRARIFYSESKN